MITTPTQLAEGMPEVVLECACCGIQLEERDEFCPDCQTPAYLSRTVASRVGTQNYISVLGASNAGKTVYLGLLLDILSKGSDRFRGMATSAFSIDLQEQVITALERRTFPEKTPNEADMWKWLHCQISMMSPKLTKHVDLISPDFAGEAIAMEVNQAGMYPAIQHVVSKSSGLLILCDSMRVRDEGSGEDLFAMKIASYVAQLHGLASDSSKGAHSGPALAVVFTKCDGCAEAMDNPADFAANHTSRLYEYCKRTFPRHSFFAASVAGSSGLIADSTGCRMRVPFHIQPQGVLEPLWWIISNS